MREGGGPGRWAFSDEAECPRPLCCENLPLFRALSGLSIDPSIPGEDLLHPLRNVTARLLTVDTRMEQFCIGMIERE